MSHVDDASRQAVEIYMRPLKLLLHDDITEVAVNIPGEAWTEKHGTWRRHLLPELTFDHLRMLAKLIATCTQQSISDSAPVVSAALPSGERVQAVLPPAVPAGTVSLTIRKPSAIRLTLDDYQTSGAFDDVCADSTTPDDTERELTEHLTHGRIRLFLERAVVTRRNIVVSGSTGSGKTTLMKALVDAIPAGERLITIEDTPELTIAHQPNHVRLFYSKDSQGVSRATPKLLLESCLRMKPDRVLLAELRGEEAFGFVRNVNSGHPGSITSIHAGSPLMAIEQLMLLIKESSCGGRLSRSDIRQLLFMLVDVVVQFGVVDGRRRVTGIFYEPARKRAALG
ncbi:type IV secretion system protein VirB11 [Luteibacter rhizovicinus]|uniref:Type IV secretion system protein n=1 Tax=Luteibacter rhizovicinus TaxID=242606 RepID=A0A4R3YTU6_9GAMM|nr:P-type DNA transfer ATPase VirB11 [Luteibacter rhizovicinus]TCV94764.1 type IV secretion system protein VirB11 [Luteibacter rhizovicinus]